MRVTLDFPFFLLQKNMKTIVTHQYSSFSFSFFFFFTFVIFFSTEWCIILNESRRGSSSSIEVLVCKHCLFYYYFYCLLRLYTYGAGLECYAGDLEFEGTNLDCGLLFYLLLVVLLLVELVPVTTRTKLVRQ